MQTALGAIVVMATSTMNRVMVVELALPALLPGVGQYDFRLVVLGDLINRGPDSAGVLNRLMHFADSADCLLGNHDLYVMAAYYGVRKLHAGDTAGELFAHPKAQAWMDWLAWRAMARSESGCLLVHAGVLPTWSVALTLELAGEVESSLRGPERLALLHGMFGSEPVAWQEGLSQVERWRVTVNALTRLRFCTPAGEMEFKTKGETASAPQGYLPWFDVPGRKSAGTPLALLHVQQPRQRHAPRRKPLKQEIIHFIRIV